MGVCTRGCLLRVPGGGTMGACGGLSGAIFNFSLIYRERGFTQVSKVFSLNGAKRLHFTLEK